MKTTPLSMGAFATLLLLPGGSHARDPKECRVLVENTKRLACYDEVHGKSEAVPVTSKGNGKWIVRAQKSKKDDSNTVTLMLSSKEAHRNRYGNYGHLDLILRCSEGKTVAYINFADEFMADSNGGGRVTYRLDKEKATTVGMEASNDHKALGLWSSTGAIAFIKKLATVQSMFVAAIPYSESEVSGTFEIEGIEQALKPLRNSCKW